MEDRRPWRAAFFWMLRSGGFFFLTYGAANWLAAQRSSVPSIAFQWERHIPFLAWTIVPYWSTDLLFALSFFVCSTRRELEIHGRRLLFAQVFCVTVFLLFPPEEIVPGIWLGRVPTRRERERMQIESLVNLAPELPGGTRGVICRSVPMLDLVTPSSADLDAAVNAVDGLRAERPTLICCALGYSRSASVMVAWLVAARLVPTVDSAIELVRKRRCHVVLSRAHRARLQLWAKERI